ncbi:MAG: hypothetical protein K9H58_19450, partial [Bacteroidales bacterium]|nr:hypothetical protein [Bacteroidales bacterium]
NLLAPIGGAGMNFGQNLVFGTVEGALIGGFDAALWGNDVGQGMIWGGVGGAAFTTLFSENFSNWTKGENFLTNENVFNNMDARGMNRQSILDYFGFEGNYDPDNSLFEGGGDPGITNPKTGEIFYNKNAFKSYDDLKFTVNHESFHQHSVLSGKYSGIKLTDQIKGREEFAAYVYNYKNQGLYPNHTFSLSSRILNAGTRGKLNYEAYFKYVFETDRPWWHIIHKIPRRW